MEADDLARGLVAGALVDVVHNRGRSLLLASLGVSIMALILGVIADGAVAVILFVVAIVGLILTLAMAVLRKAAIVAIRHIGEPQSVRQYRAAFSHAIDDAALPTGPIAAAKFAWRLRKGTDAETERLKDVVARLRTELEL